MGLCRRSPTGGPLPGAARHPPVARAPLRSASRFKG